MADIPSPEDSLCSYEECREVCLATTACQGWSWVSDLASPHYGKCKLSQLSHDPAGTIRAITGQKTCQGRQSIFHLRNIPTCLACPASQCSQHDMNAIYAGPTIGEMMQKESAAACGDSCRSESGCQHWTWFLDLGICRLFQERTNLAHRKNYISSSRECVGLQ